MERETWDTLPEFATDEHHQLFDLVKNERQQLDNLKLEAVENDERALVLNEHLKNVQRELLHAQVRS